MTRLRKFIFKFLSAQKEPDDPKRVTDEAAITGHKEKTKRHIITAIFGLIVMSMLSAAVIFADVEIQTPVFTAKRSTPSNLTSDPVESLEPQSLPSQENDSASRNQKPHKLDIGQSN